LWPGQKKGMHRAAKVQISTSDSGLKWRFRIRKAAAIFLLNKDGGVFNTSKIIALLCT
jgi:hypothetical protein